MQGEIHQNNYEFLLLYRYLYTLLKSESPFAIIRITSKHSKIVGGMIQCG